jgi:hypothetical protein
MTKRAAASDNDLGNVIAMRTHIMQALSQPDPALAARILADVSYEQRLVGYRCRARWGQVRAHIYGFKELALLLRDRRPAIDLGVVERWLRTVIGDGELADRVAEVIAAAPADQERMRQVGSLLDERLAQCRQIAAQCSAPAQRTGAPV